jgi:hypothetical protein
MPITDKTTFTRWNSSFFSVCQPDSYSEDDRLNELENEKNDHHYDCCRTLVEIPLNKLYKNQKTFNFGKNFKAVKERRMLPKEHKLHLDDVVWELDRRKYRHDVLSAAWMHTFESFIAIKYQKLKGFTAPKITAAGVHSPREYNFMTDASLFDIAFKKGELERIAGAVLKNDQVFDAFLRESYSPRPGFRPFGAWTLEYWRCDFYREADTGNWQYADMERACYRLFDFWLFAYDIDNPAKTPSLKIVEENQERFEGWYEEIKYEYHDTKLDNCFTVVPREADNHCGGTASCITHHLSQQADHQ